MKCLLIEDEPLALELIEGYIKDTSDLELVKSFPNALLASDFIRKNADSFDFLILDVKMPKITGTEFLKTLQHQPPVIFITAYSEYAVESYDFNTLDFLTKPVAFHRFLKAIEKVRQRLVEKEEEEQTTRKFFFIKEKDVHQKVLFSDILWIEGMADYVKVRLADKQYVYHSSMKSILLKLPSNFLRIHQSFIVNSHKIETVRGNRVWMNGEEIPIGRTYKTALQELLNM